jgi:cytochrome c peroxidase
MSPSFHRLLLAPLFALCLSAGAAPLDEPLKPLPTVPRQNPLRVELGRQLFNETRLSVNGSLSCASCHRLENGGADNKAFSIGFAGLPVTINTPSVFNAVVQSPSEMGSNWEHVVQTLTADTAYQTSFANAYPDGVTMNNVQNALATYERTLISANSRFDQYLQGNTDILTLDEKYGYQRFKDYGCIACHQGVNIGGNMFQKFGVMGDYFKVRGNPTEADLGRYLVTKDEEDRNVFKVPSLRNVAVTAPYFHDGSATTLEDAVDVMFKFQLGRIPSADDKTLIIKFLKTLTGEWGGKPL